MNHIKQIHAHTLKIGKDETKLLIEKLLQIPNIGYAQSLFDFIPNPTVFLYNKLIQAYSLQIKPNQCLFLYTQMCSNGCPPNQHSFTFLFAAFASLSSPLHGKKLHTHFVKSGFGFDSYALTALVDMYAKMGMLKPARKVFDEMRFKDVPTWNSMITGYLRCGYIDGGLELFNLMPLRNVVSWTAMISGYSQNGKYLEALEMFLRMEKEKGLVPNHVTLASVLPACANLGALEVGERIVCFAREKGLLKNLYVCNAVLEMYGRCGRIDLAKKVFDEMGSRRNLCSWNSMIMGLAVHGKCNEALELYNQMLEEGTRPDDVTFVGLLLACTHGGLVPKGRQIFESMHKQYDIDPKLEHYGCMVDLLGRAGALQEAYVLIKSMPMKPDCVIWGALLGACSFHGNVEIGEIAAESLFELEPWNPGNYVILSNIYASKGQWDGVAKLRKKMKVGEITKTAGYSFVEGGEGGGEVHKFIVGDKSHSQSDEIYRVLDDVSRKMKREKMSEDFYFEDFDELNHL